MCGRRFVRDTETVERDEILSEIRATAADNDGKPLGHRKFTELTGVSAYQWGKYWARWSDATRDAGFDPNTFLVSFDKADVLGRYFEVIRELGKVPTRGELRLRRTNDLTFPEERTFFRLSGTRNGSKSGLIRVALDYCQDKPEYADVQAILEREQTGDDEPSSNDDATAVGFVYLAKARRGEYKIGRTNLVDRRLAEVGVTGPVELTLVHEIKTDDPVGVEAYWHQRFAGRRLRGEWFRLSAADVKMFKRWRRIY